jgi:putative ABC transport system substrate-binding protein
MKRREFITLLAGATAALPWRSTYAQKSTRAAAEAAGKVYKVGILNAGGANAAIRVEIEDGIVRVLAGLGYSIGRNLVIESRAANNQPERLPKLAEELVGSGVDVIVTISYPAARAAKDVTTTVPIVAYGAADPVETGLAVSLNQPGGNLTGISDMAADLSTKRLQLLKALVPGLQRVAILWNANDPAMTARYQAAAAVAPALGVAIQALAVREPDDFDTAFAAMNRERPDGILLVTDVLTILNRKRVIEFAADHRLPAIYEFDFLVRDGGLMSYGPDGKETAARIGGLVGRILQGAKPADLPFEQPTRFRFVINQRTANALGLTVPQSLIVTADEIIE